MAGPNNNVILQWNINGLKCNRHELDILIAQYTPVVIRLQEVRLPFEMEGFLRDNKPLPHYVNIKGYTPYIKCIPSGHNGVAIYVKNSVIHSPVNLILNGKHLPFVSPFRKKCS